MNEVYYLENENISCNAKINSNTKTPRLSLIVIQLVIGTWKKKRIFKYYQEFHYFVEHNSSVLFHIIFCEYFYNL